MEKEEWEARKKRLREKYGRLLERLPEEHRNTLLEALEAVHRHGMELPEWKHPLEHVDENRIRRIREKLEEYRAILGQPSPELTQRFYDTLQEIQKLLHEVPALAEKEKREREMRKMWETGQPVM